MSGLVALAVTLAMAACLLKIDDHRLDATPDATKSPDDAIGVPSDGATVADGSRALCDGVDAALCTDFDHEAINAGWTTAPAPDPPHVFELTDAAFRSPPYAARIGNLAFASGDAFFQTLTWSTIAVVGRARLAFALKLEALDGACINLLRIENGKNRLDISAGYEAGCATQEVVDHAPEPIYRDATSGPAIPRGSFGSVVVDLDFGATPRGTLEIDGAPFAAIVLDPSWAATPNVARRLSIALGPRDVSAPSGTQLLLLDDVVFSVSP